MQDTSLRRAITAGVLYVAIVFAAGFVLGAIRGLVIAPAIGETAAIAIEIPIILAISWVVCRAITTRLALPPTRFARVTMGAVAFALLMVAEFLLALAFGRTPAEHFASYRGGASMLGLAGQMAFAALPLLQRGARAKA